MHGSDQLRAHADAARTVSRLKAEVAEADSVDGPFDDELDTLYRSLAVAKAELYVRYLEYTNPHGVVKTV